MQMTYHLRWKLEKGPYTRIMSDNVIRVSSTSVITRVEAPCLNQQVDPAMFARFTKGSLDRVSIRDIEFQLEAKGFIKKARYGVRRTKRV